MYVYRSELKAQGRFPIEHIYVEGDAKKADAQVASKKDIEQEQQISEEQSNSKSITQKEDLTILIPGGSFLTARKTFSSKVWLKHPTYYRVWEWIYGHANHADYTKNGRRYKRGEIITIYDEIIKGVAYYYRNSFRYLTLKQIRTILDWLKTEKMIEVEPIYQNKGFGLNRADLKSKEKADLKTRERAEGSSLIGHNNKNGKNDITPEIFSFKKRYSNQELIDQAFNAMRSTRKSNKVANTVLLAQLQKWERYPVEHVEEGIRIYLEKGYAEQGKDESYLLGIIRRQEKEETAKQKSKEPIPPYYTELT